MFLFHELKYFEFLACIIYIRPCQYYSWVCDFMSALYILLFSFIVFQWIAPQIFKLLPKQQIFFDHVISLSQTGRQYAFF